jgi:hypothetical protein
MTDNECCMMTNAHMLYTLYLLETMHGLPFTYLGC